MRALDDFGVARSGSGVSAPETARSWNSYTTPVGLAPSNTEPMGSIAVKDEDGVWVSLCGKGGRGSRPARVSGWPAFSVTRAACGVAPQQPVGAVRVAAVVGDGDL
jgi:hypothetical protein